MGIADYALGAAIVAGSVLRGALFDDAAWGIAFAALVLVGSRSAGPTGRFLSHPLLAGIGIFSYSVYLIHQPIIMGIGDRLKRHPMPNALHWFIVIFILIPALVGMGYVYHLLFEKPFMSSSKKAPLVAGPVRDEIASQDSTAEQPSILPLET